MSALKLHTPEGSQARDGAGGDSVASWLDVLEKLLGLPAEEARAIRDELASHLRDRVRDLAVSGMVEGEAVRTAIGELGDAAELARRFQLARRTSKRSTVMNIALVSAVVVAMGAGGLAIRGSVQASRAQEVADAARVSELTAKNQALQAFTAAVLAESRRGDAERAGGALAQGDGTIEQQSALLHALMAAGGGVDGAVVSCAAKDTWQGFFEGAAKAAGKGLFVHYASMGPMAVDAKSVVGMDLKDVTLADAVRLINENAPGFGSDGRIAYRATDSLLEFASEESFDRREKETRTYDLDVLVKGLLAKEADGPGPKEEERHSRVSAEQSVCEEVSHLIQEMVNDKMWADNGGDMASIRRFGSKLFITAPGRHFKEIEWVLKEAGAFEKPQAMAAPVPVTMTISVDAGTNQLVIADAGGRSVRCTSLRFETPEVVSAVLENATAEVGVPVLGEVPIINTNFTRRAALMTLMPEVLERRAVLVEPVYVPAPADGGPVSPEHEPGADGGN